MNAGDFTRFRSHVMAAAMLEWIAGRLTLDLKDRLMQRDELAPLGIDAQVSGLERMEMFRAVQDAQALIYARAGTILREANRYVKIDTPEPARPDPATPGLFPSEVLNHD